jgi:uncharacterized protein YbaR (Trm112 family)
MYELLARLSCPLCGGDRSTSVLAVVESRHETHQLVRAQCVRCHLFWSFPLEWLAQVTIDDAETQFVPAEPISMDEVLDVHLLLRDYRGPLTGLLNAA